MPTSPALRTLLDKVAVDNGFDLERPSEGDWLAYATTQAPLRIWLSALADGVLLVALSQLHVARALDGYGVPLSAPLPAAAVAARTVADPHSLHRLLRRALQLSKTLPDELLHEFHRQTAGLPQRTEAERLVVQRKGQGLFRAGLLDYWEGRCAVTGLAVPELLRASHIKPWADANDGERLDVFNGLLLAPHLDAVFDRGFVTVDDDGALRVSTALCVEDRKTLGLAGPLRVARLVDRHRAYLPWHREHVFERSVTSPRDSSHEPS